jgi:hypothetical protein
MLFFNSTKKQFKGAIQIAYFYGSIKTDEELQNHSKLVNEFIINKNIVDVSNTIINSTQIMTTIEYEFGKLDQLIGNIKSAKLFN